MRMAVEAWASDYGAEIGLGAPDERTVEGIDPNCERRPWAPVAASEAASRRDGPIAFVDGTRRLDARVYVSENGAGPVPGVAASIGVGAVVCDPRPRADGRGSWPARRAEVVDVRIERFLAVGEGRSVGLTAGPGLEYRPLPHTSSDLDQLVDAIHDQMRAGEAALAQELADGSRLVLVDGPLAVMRPGPQAIVGLIKSHHRRYLDDDHEDLLGRLGCGERTPLFAFGEPRPRYSWYLRLCGLADDDHAWHGLVRCESPAALSLDVVVELADASAALLPAFAAPAHWDPRAPQNLVPIAGLEKRLRHLLGDRVLVNRMIKDAAKRMGEGEKSA